MIKINLNKDESNIIKAVIGTKKSDRSYSYIINNNKPNAPDGPLFVMNKDNVLLSYVTLEKNIIENNQIKEIKIKDNILSAEQMGNSSSHIFSYKEYPLRFKIYKKDIIYLENYVSVMGEDPIKLTIPNTTDARNKLILEYEEESIKIQVKVNIEQFRTDNRNIEIFFTQKYLLDVLKATKNMGYIYFDMTHPEEEYSPFVFEGEINNTKYKSIIATRIINE